jgi:hypothetical protein
MEHLQVFFTKAYHQLQRQALIQIKERQVLRPSANGYEGRNERNHVGCE